MRQGNHRKPVAQRPAAWRSWAVLAAFAVAAVILTGRAFELQIIDQDFLVLEGEKRHVRSLEVPAGRGAILDRHGRSLALSAPVESVWAVPESLLGEPQHIEPLADLLEIPAEDLKETLEQRRDRRFLYLRRHLNPAAAKRVSNLNAPGVFLQREYRRYYPAGEAAAQLVGFTDIDSRGQEGIELGLDKRLTGAPGSRRVLQDRLGRIAEDLAEFKPPHPGEDVSLSIDLRLQYLAYRALKAGVMENRAKSGIVVVVNPASGELLAMASYPSYNPNDRGSLDSTELRNRAATDVFEPGSTVKPLLVAKALDSGAFKPTSVISTHGGRFQVGRLTVRDFRDYGDVTLRRLLTKSSNVGAAKIGLRMGRERLWNAYSDFGFGELSGTAFPGERPGVLRGFFEWGEIHTATHSYGYGLSVTGLQLIRAYTALAADGVMSELTLLKAGEQGFASQRRRVVTQETTGRIREMLRSVVSPEGTARRARLEGYTVAGKTGTARKVGARGYIADAHQAVFVGMAPADNPRLLTLVMIDEPRAGAYYGGAVAAPVFAEVMQDAMRLLHVPPDQPAELTAHHGPPSEKPS